MKWKKGPSDFFPEKTFLIIKDNVESFSGKIFIFIVII